MRQIAAALALWGFLTAPAAAPIAAPIATQVQMPGPAQVSSQLPWRAQDFLNALGVNTHVGYTDTVYADTAGVLAALRHVGFRTVREATPTWPVGSPNYARWITLLDAGLKMSLGVPGVGGDVIGQMQGGLHNLASAYPNQIIGIEGGNEPSIILGDRYTALYKSFQGPAAVAAFQLDLYHMVKGDPLLRRYPVWGFTLHSRPYDQTSYEAVYAANPAVMSAADVLNAHAYSGTYAPYYKLQYQVFNASDIGFDGTKYTYGPYYHAMSSYPTIVTETGWTGTNTPSPKLHIPDYNSQAILVLDQALDSFALGAKRVFLYELLDLRRDPENTNVQNHFGLFDSAFGPKIAATALKNIFAFLADPARTAASFTPTPLVVTVPAFPLRPAWPFAGSPNGSGYTLVTQDSRGAWSVFVWYEPQVVDQATGIGRNPPDAAITMNFSRTCATTVVYDPFTGTRTVGASNTATLSVALPAHPLIVRCAP